MDSNNNQLSDFSAVGLDRYMRPLNAPVTAPSNFVGGMQFNTNYDRNAVTAVNLRNFSFNAGTGGTIVLGGTNNGNGNFTIKDSLGSTIVTGDNTGLTVTNGSITVKNSSGSTTLDSKGIVSLSNFNNGGASTISGFNQQIKTSTPEDITGATFTFILTRSTKILTQASLITYMTNGGTGNYQGDGLVFIEINNGEVQRTVETGGVSGGNDIGCGNVIVSSHMHDLRVFSAGTYTIKLQASVNTTSGTPWYVIYRSNFSYTFLGN